jgi:hypothetical protein
MEWGSLIGGSGSGGSVSALRRDRELSRGIAIGSILRTDEHSHLEPVRDPAWAS